MKNLEQLRDMKRDLIRKREEISIMKSGKRKIKAMKVYAELLVTLELSEAS